MKKIAIGLLTLVGLAGCVAYPVPYGNGPDYRNHDRGHERDRDGDGERNRNDRRPNDQRRD